MLIDSKVQMAAIYITCLQAKLEKEVTFFTFVVVILLPWTTLIGFFAERNTTQGYDL